MTDEYVNYQNTWLRYNRECAVLALLCAGFVIFVTLTACSYVVLPFGIIGTIWCVMIGSSIVKRCKKCREYWRRVKEYRQTHELSATLGQDTTYCFFIPYPIHIAADMLVKVLTVVGGIKDVDTRHGVVTGYITISKKKKQAVTFYIGNNERNCKVRAVFEYNGNDDWWDIFLRALFRMYPGDDFGVTVANGNPLIAGVLDLQGDTQQIAYSRTTGGTSLTGFLLGGALFGEAGAIVGGMSGKTRTYTDVRAKYSDELLVRIIYTNGRIWEGTVQKDSDLYNEILVNAK